MARSELSRGVQDEIDVDGVVGELHLAIILAIEYPGPEQRMDIAMYGAHVAPGAPGDFAYRQRALARHDLEQGPALWREGLPEQILRGERDIGALALAPQSIGRSPLCVLHRGHSDRHRVHLPLLRLLTARQKSACSACRSVKA